ncbi:MAG: polysulfide reductase NrfD [Ardenticatenaceae bacterium]|nr:polysulfide reductase NrfD [Ardenticatenaceae bacterium]
MKGLITLVQRRVGIIWMLGLLALMGAGAVAGVRIFTQGLWLTNMNDLVPWGLWITIDLSAIAMSAGAFLLSAAVYLLRIKRLMPVAKTAVFIGLIGYSMAVMTLLLDIGRPDRFWHALAFWNIHSPLWEVTMCVTLYLSVLTLEVLPIVGEAPWFKQRWPLLSDWLHKIHKLAPFLAILGLLLSLMHQSSLGATYGVLVARPVLYRPGLAMIFLLSAMAAGPAFTVLVSKVASYLTKAAVVDRELLDEVSRVVGWVLVAYLYVRTWDLLAQLYTYQPGRNEGLSLLFDGPLSTNFWVGEMALGIVVPMIILLSSRLRRYDRAQILALLLVVAGLVAHRWDTNMVGQMLVLQVNPFADLPLYTHYVPSLIEITAGLGVIAYGALAVTLGIKHLRIIDHKEVEPVIELETAVLAAD